MQGPASILWTEILTLVCPFWFPLLNQRSASVQHLGLPILPRCGMAGQSCGVSLWEGCQIDSDLGLWIGWNLWFRWPPPWRYPSSVTCNTVPPDAMESPKITSSICSLHLLPEFCTNTCFSPSHWGRTICGKADSTGPVHPDPVQHSDEGGKNISCCCGVRHWHELHEFLGDGQSGKADKYGQLRNICNVAKNDFSLCFNWLSKSSERSEILSATVFLARLIFAGINSLPA